METKQEISHKGYIIHVYEHIDVGNWAYSIYKVTSSYRLNKQKRTRVRAMDHYITPNAAEKAAKAFIDNHLIS